jgi:4-aminobutyrate aminotransferase/(S)-3-amino-2-methylpropionate transaminase
MFAIEHNGIEPDLIVLAKTLGGGLPLAAVVGRAELMDATAPGGLGGTFGGNPVACAGALAIIDVLLEERLPERADQIGRTAMDRMRSWAERVPAIGEVRGLGAMVAIELVKDRVSREPDPQLTTAILHRCHDRGLAILKAGLYDNVIRLLPPLTISDDELRRGLDILEESVSSRE